jgi:AraC-like DNA-binding protein
MIVWGSGYTSAPHSHHSIQLVFALEGALRIRAKPGARWLKCGAVLIRPSATHAVEALGGMVLITFVDPQSDLGTSLTRQIRSDITRLAWAKVNRWRAIIGPAGLTGSSVEDWARGELLPESRMPEIHPGVERVLRHLRKELGSSEDVSLAKLAGIAGLSRSRFMHVFTESVGVPLRPYILWLRLQRACGELAQGANITEAAHHAGFSDGAHLTRTFRRMLGATPTEIVQRSRASQGVSVASKRA